jgi:cysteine desulfurase
MTLDGHKIGGPKGIACLAIRDRINLSPIIYGGGQEKGLRPGTEPLGLIVGFTSALEEAQKGSEERSIRVKKVRDELLRLISKELPEAVINGSLERRVANNINISIPGIDPEFVVLKMDAHGVAISTKSSCLKGEEESYVVFALSKDHERARTTLRFTFLQNASIRDARRVFQVLKRAVTPRV